VLTLLQICFFIIKVEVTTYSQYCSGTNATVQGFPVDHVLGGNQFKDGVVLALHEFSRGLALLVILYTSLFIKVGSNTTNTLQTQHYEKKEKNN